jgi:hypothetical protein
MGIKWDSMDKLKEKDKECVVISNDTNSTSDIKKISIRKRNVNVGNSPICLID